MSDIAIVGAGNGGLATAVDLGMRGHNVRLYNRSSHRIEPIHQLGGIEARGVLGEGVVPVAEATTDLPRAISGAEFVIVNLPAHAHAHVASALSSLLDSHVPIILNPGHMCGSLHFRRVFSGNGAPEPRLAETGTLTHVCRSHAPATVDIYLRARQVPVAVVPGEDPELASAVQELFPETRLADNPVEAWLHDVNMVLHPPGMVHGASRIESSQDGFLFYAEGITPAVEATLAALDEERRSVGRAYGVELPSLAETMATFGTGDADAARRGDLGEAVRSGWANKTIRAPSSLDHRYLHEDIPYGLVPLVALARVAAIDMPVANALVVLAEVITGRDYRGDGLSEETLGLAGMDLNTTGLLARGGEVIRDRGKQ